MDRRARPSTTRAPRTSDPQPGADSALDDALQIFLFEQDRFLGSTLYSSRRPVVIGRDADATLQLPSDTVSRTHCRLVWTSGTLELEDLGSSNGTFVNGHPILRHRLGFEDTLTVGRYTLKVRTLRGDGPLPIDPDLAGTTTRIEAAAGRAPSPLVSLDDDETEIERPFLAETDPSFDRIFGFREPRLSSDVEARLRDLDELLDALDPPRDPAELRRPRPSVDPVAATPIEGMEPSSSTVDTIANAVALKSRRAANDDPATERLRVGAEGSARVSGRASRARGPRPGTPTGQRVQVYPVDSAASAPSRADEPSRRDQVPNAIGDRLSVASAPRFVGVEIAARTRGRLVQVAVLREPADEYILGHPTPQGDAAPARQHIGLRLVKVNQDRTVDLVFPNDVSGHLIRGPHSVSLRSLTEGRKYSCLRLDPADIAAIWLGCGRDAVSYHLRFLRRPASEIRDRIFGRS